MNPYNQAEEDALRTIKELNTIRANISEITRETALAEDLLNRISEGTEITEEQLQKLDLTKQSPRALKLRLKGILSTKEQAITELEITYNKNRELLKSLLTCPSCSGQGTTTTLSYNRDEGKITPIPRSSQCPDCQGSGKASLSAHTKSLTEPYILDNLNV